MRAHLKKWGGLYALAAIYAGFGGISAVREYDRRQTENRREHASAAYMYNRRPNYLI